MNNPSRYTDPTGHYGQDVHVGLTYEIVWESAFRIAIARGYSDEQASHLAGNFAIKISTADQDVDYKESALVKPGADSAEVARHWYTTPQAEDELTSANTSGEFGKALHAYQDSYSHWQKLGKPDMPGEIWEGHKQNQFDSMFGWNKSIYIDTFDPAQNPIDAKMQSGTKMYVNYYLYSKIMAVPTRSLVEAK